MISERVAAALGGLDAGELEVPGSEGATVARRALVFHPGDRSALPATMPSTFSKKGVVEVDGATRLAELVVVRLFTRAGWEAGWWNPFGGAGWVADGDLSLRRHRSAPTAVRPVLELVDARRGTRGGRWDVVACRGDYIAFAECKRRRRDRLKDNQGQWLRGCLEVGVPLDAFVVVEWDLASSSEPASHALI